MAFDIPTVPLDDAAPVFAVLLAIVVVAPLVARAVRLPDVAVLLLAGVAVGPGGLGLLERDGGVGLLGAAGVLYLMFVAGVELDLEDFLANRGDSVRFGVLTFAIPLVLGTVVALGLGFGMLPSVLLGSCWSSHTLLAYPQFRRAGTAGHRAVATSVGATILTDTAALLVLAVVVRAHEGALSAAFWATLLPAFGVVVTTVWFGLPRLARRVFAGPGQDPSVRLLFVLVSLFGVSALTSLVGVEPIVGAFLAGLALNRSVPAEGALMGRIDLLGSVLFIPLFLVATGMLVDVRVLLDPTVLGWAAAFTAVAVVAKAAAAVVAGRWLRATLPEVGTMVSLSMAQAAATLAAVVVGVEAGLLGEGVVGAVVVVVLATCLLSSVLASRVAPVLSTTPRDRPFGDVVVAPVVNPTTGAGLLRLAARIAVGDAGVVVPLVVAPAGGPDTLLEERRALLARVTAVAQSAGVEARPVLRVDTTAVSGIVHTVQEQRCSLLVLGLRERGGGGARLDGVVEDVLAATDVASLLVGEGSREVGRVVLAVGGPTAVVVGAGALSLALRSTAALLGGRRLPVLLATDLADPAPVTRAVSRHLGVAPTIHGARRPSAVLATLEPGDLLVLPVTVSEGLQRQMLTRVLRHVPDDVTTMVAIARGAGPPSDRAAVARPRTATG